MLCLQDICYLTECPDLIPDGKQHRRKGERLNEVKEGLLLYRLGLEAHLKGRRHQENMEASMAKRDKERICPKCQLVMDTEETWALHLSKCQPKMLLSLKLKLK